MLWQIKMMMKLLKLIPLFLVLLILGCSEEKKPNKYGYNTDLQGLLDDSNLSAEEFRIDNTRDTTLFGSKGTIISIPKNCFENVKGPIKIELIESFKLSDIVLLNAQTVSNGKLLQTDGVIYLSASVNDNEVILKKEKSIQIEIPSSNRIDDMTAFVGNYNPDGVMNWEHGNEMVWSTSEQVKEITQYRFFTIPLDLFPNRMQYEKMDSIGKKYPITSQGIFAPLPEHLMGKPKRDFYSKILELLNNVDNINTPLATREFAKRLEEIEYYYIITYNYPDGRNPGHSFIKNPFEKIQLELFHIYADNIDRPLMYSDSLTLLKLNKFKKKNFDKDSDERLDKLITLFEDFKNQKLSYPVKINNYGIDLESPKAYQLLIQKGINKDSARLSIELHNTRQKIIESLKLNFKSEQDYLAKINVAEKNQEESFKVQYYLIEANQLGWINIDRFYNSPNAENFNLLANFTTPEDLEFLNVSLVIPNQKSYLTGYKNKDGKYQFTKENEYYTKLPIGETGYLIGISYQNGKPILGLKEISIGENEMENITASSIELSDFKNKMDKLN
jgi:hypothetical protein